MSPVKKSRAKGYFLILASIVYILFIGAVVDYFFDSYIRDIPSWARTALMIFSISPFFAMLAIGYNKLKANN